MMVERDQNDMPNLNLRDPKFAPIAEVLRESSKSNLKLISQEIRESHNSKAYSFKQDPDLVHFREPAKVDEETKQVPNAEHHTLDFCDNHTDEDYEDEQVQMQPYSFRSKLNTDKTKMSRTLKQDKIVERLYTVKTIDNKIAKTSTFKDIIKVEEHTPNAKYNHFLDRNIRCGLKSSSNKNTGGFSPSKVKQHRHKNSNTDTLVKSSSFKSSQQCMNFGGYSANLVSKYGAHFSKSPENPSLVISKKPIETQQQETNNSK